MNMKRKYKKLETEIQVILSWDFKKQEFFFKEKI